jgi:Fur family transcriptional regulator, stress-responsive regulator
MVLVPVNPDDVVVQELRAAGLRVTMPRQAVLTWLGRYPHCTADAIAAGVREKFGALSLQVCRRCAQTEDIDCVAGKRPCLEPAAAGSVAGTLYHEEEWQ